MATIINSPIAEMITKVDRPPIIEIHAVKTVPFFSMKTAKRIAPIKFNQAKRWKYEEMVRKEVYFLTTPTEEFGV